MSSSSFVQKAFSRHRRSDPGRLQAAKLEGPGADSKTSTATLSTSRKTNEDECVGAALIVVAIKDIQTCRRPD